MNYKLFIGMLAIVLAGCSTKTPTADNESSEVRELKTKKYTFEESTKHYTAQLECDFPVGGDDELVDSVYDYVISNVGEACVYEDDYPDLKGEGQRFVDYFGKQLADGMEDAWYSYTEGEENGDEVYDFLTINIIEDNDRFITYKMEHSGFFGGDGFIITACTTFIREEARRITNRDIFRNPSSPKLIDLVRDAVRQKFCQGEEPIMEVEFLDNLKGLPRRACYLTADGVGFIYEPYEVYAYSLDIELPVEELRPFLTDEARQLLGDDL